MGDDVTLVVPPEWALTSHARRQLDLHPGEPWAVHGVPVVQSAEAHRDLSEVGDDAIAGEQRVDVASHMVGEVAVASTEQQ